MARRAEPDDKVDPVRSRLAESVSAPVRPAKPEAAAPAQPVQRKPITNGATTTRAKKTAKPLKKAGKPDALTLNRKFMVSEHDAQLMEEMTTAISAAFGSKVTSSAVNRALWAVIANSEEAIAAGGRGHNREKLTVPSKGDHLAMVEYEHTLAEFLAAALKRA